MSATNQNDSFPVTNLTHQFLEKRFQSTTTTSVITGLFTADQTISAIGLGFHNLSSATYVLKDSGGSPVGSGSLSVAYETDITYFTAIACRSIEITATSSTTLYLGGISADDPLYFEYHNIDPRFDYISNDSSTQTRGGQALGVKSKRLNKYRAVLGHVTLAQKQSLNDMLDTVGNVYTFFGDLYDEAHTEARPLFCKLEGDGVFKRQSTSNDYVYTIVLKEAR